MAGLAAEKRGYSAIAFGRRRRIVVPEIVSLIMTVILLLCLFPPPLLITLVSSIAYHRRSVCIPRQFGGCAYKKRLTIIIKETERSLRGKNKNIIRLKTQRHRQRVIYYIMYYYSDGS